MATPGTVPPVLPLSAAREVGWRQLALALSLLGLLCLGEARLYQRLLFVDPVQYGFVLLNVEGVLTGRPVSKSWQQRWLAPGMIAGLDRLTGQRFKSLRVYNTLLLTAANLWLFALARRRGNSAWASLAIVLAFGFAHLLLLYKLEYPWDSIDILLMLSFGYAAARGWPLRRLWPLLLIGLFNHETILYVPVFYMLSALEQPDWRRRARTALPALTSIVALSCAIYALRERFYRGRPELPESSFEAPMPVVENHLHIVHNLRQWWWSDFHESRWFISLSLTAACLACLVAAARGLRRSAALWTLLVIASIVCFGYVNETRHYLVLVAFWFGYACPRLRFDAERAHHRASATGIGR